MDFLGILINQYDNRFLGNRFDEKNIYTVK